MPNFRKRSKKRAEIADALRAEQVPTGSADEAEQQSRSLNLTPTVPDDQMYSWESQASQYPPDGPTGISYFRGQLSEDLYVDCLLYRDENGVLVGILNHYPMDIPPHEREGDENVWVHPEHRRQGIGSALLLEARVRWGGREDPGAPKLTESGVEWVQALADRYGGTEFDWREVGWDVWLERRRQERESQEPDWRDLRWEFWHKRWARDNESAEQDPEGEAGPTER